MNDGEIQAFRTQLINPRAIGDGGCGIQVFVKFIFYNVQKFDQTIITIYQKCYVFDREKGSIFAIFSVNFNICLLATLVQYDFK